MAKPIFLLYPANSTPQIEEKIELFLNSYWLPKHSYPDILKLYHYTTLEGLKGILQNRSIWCGHISTLNDPSELQYGKTLVISKLDEMIDKEEEKYLKNILKNLLLFIKAFDTQLYHTYIICFCGSDNLLSQWRSYASRAGGYNLGIFFYSDTKFSHNFNNPKDQSEMMLRKIIYNLNEQEEIISKYLSNIVSGSNNAMEWFRNNDGIPQEWETQVAMESVNILYDMILSFKNSAFKEENEWRLIKVMAANHRPELIKFRENNNRVIPYLETIIYENENGTLTFPLHEIRFGPMLDEISTKKVLELFINKTATEKSKVIINAHKIKIEGAGYLLRN